MNDTAQKFNECIKKGAIGEAIVREIILERERPRQIVDVRKDKRFQEDDIDFLIEDNEGQFTSVEVKTDFYAQNTENIVYELTYYNGFGCFERTKADYIYYYIPRAGKSGVIYIFKPYNLRTWLQKTHPEEITIGEGATGFLCPIKELQSEKVIERAYYDVS